MAFTNERIVGRSGLGCPGCPRYETARSGMGGTYWQVSGVSTVPGGYSIHLREKESGTFSDDDTGKTTTASWPVWAGRPPTVGATWDAGPAQAGAIPPGTAGVPAVEGGAGGAGGGFDLSALLAAIPGITTAAGKAAQPFLTTQQQVSLSSMLPGVPSLALAPRPAASIKAASASWAPVVGVALGGLGIGIASAWLSRRSKRRG